MPRKPSQISVTNINNEAVEFVSDYDSESKTIYLRFENSPDGISVKIDFE